MIIVKNIKLTEESRENNFWKDFDDAFNRSWVQISKWFKMEDM